MISSLYSIVSAIRRFRRGTVFGVLSLIAACAISGSLIAQNGPPANTDAGNGADTGGGNGGNGGNDNGNGRRRGNYSPEAMLSALKDQFGITDDSEWNVISQRVQAVIDLRRGAGGGIRLNVGGNGRGNRVGRGGSPELDALRVAVANNMPDDEIKSRLEHYREVRKENEEKLTKAQEDLRAVLTIRQEAIAVMVGLLN